MTLCAAAAQPATADSDLDHATQLDPKGFDAYMYRGNVYFGKGDYDRAIADYDQAIQLYPKNANAYVRRGFAYYRKGDDDRAISDYDQAIRLDPKFATPHNDRRFRLLEAARPGSCDRRLRPSDHARSEGGGVLQQPRRSLQREGRLRPGDRRP
jgi:tetratricopeptide (TPR) repeat protein